MFRSFDIVRSSALALALVVAAGNIAAPAFAAPAAPTASVEMQAEPTSRATDTTTDTRKYCANMSVSGQADVTGSMLSKKVCKTRAAWAAKGVVIPAN